MKLLHLAERMETGIEQNLFTRSWQITRRWQEYEGELRGAILRVALVAACYAIQLLHYLVFAEGDEVDRLFHRQVTAIAACWLFVSLGVLVALRQRFFPRALKFITSAFDLVLLTSCAMLGSGPDSPLISCYYLLIAMSALRASLLLVWQATLSSMAAYMLLVGLADSTWFDANHTTPVAQQLITLLTMAGVGVTVGQVVRMMSASANEYLQRYHHLSEGDEDHE